MMYDSSKSDRFLKNKLCILRRTLKLRGTDVIRLRNVNEDYNLVHGNNMIDYHGDLSSYNERSIIRVVLNVNDFEEIWDKGIDDQTFYHLENDFNPGDLIQYKNEIHTYTFKVDQRKIYGERNLLYEYTLHHLTTTDNDEIR